MSDRQHGAAALNLQARLSPLFCNRVIITSNDRSCHKTLADFREGFSSTTYLFWPPIEVVLYFTAAVLAVPAANT